MVFHFFEKKVTRPCFFSVSIKIFGGAVSLVFNF